MSLFDSLMGGSPDQAAPTPSASLDPQYLDAIKGFEGYQPNASWDYKQYSSGYGTKAQPGDENIPPDQRQAVYDQRFQGEIGNAANSVDSFAPNLPPGVRAALTSLTYNAGPGWQQSGLGQAIKAGDFGKAKDLFLQYNHAGGDVNPGLTARRQKEAAWFDSGLPAVASNTPSAPQPSPQSASPLQASVTPSQPYFPSQVAPQAAGGPASASPAYVAPQPLQIQYAQRHPVDLSRLRAQLAQAPIYARG